MGSAKIPCSRRLLACFSTFIFAAGSLINFIAIINLSADSWGPISYRYSEGGVSCEVIAVVHFVCFVSHAILELLFNIHYDTTQATLFGVASIIDGMAYSIQQHGLYAGLHLFASILWLMTSLIPFTRCTEYKLNKKKWALGLLRVLFVMVAVSMLWAASLSLNQQRNANYVFVVEEQSLPTLLFTILAFLYAVADLCCGTCHLLIPEEKRPLNASGNRCDDLA